MRERAEITKKKTTMMTGSCRRETIDPILSAVTYEYFSSRRSPSLLVVAVLVVLVVIISRSSRAFFSRRVFEAPNSDSSFNARSSTSDVQTALGFIDAPYSRAFKGPVESGADAAKESREMSNRSPLSLPFSFCSMHKVSRDAAIPLSTNR